MQGYLIICDLATNSSDLDSNASSTKFSVGSGNKDLVHSKAGMDKSTPASALLSFQLPQLQADTGMNSIEFDCKALRRVPFWFVMLMSEG